MLQLPVVLLLDLTTWKIYNVGVFLDINHDVFIPVEGGNTMQKWSVETNLYHVIPSMGNREDMLIEDRSYRRVKIMLCQLIGVSRDGEEVHAEWASDVFPSETYELPPKLGDLPDNYIFVRPFGMRNWIRGMLRQKMNGLTHVYSQLYKIIQKYEQQNKEMTSYYDNLFLKKIQAANETSISNWQYIIDSWDFLMKERTVPLYVISRLLHVEQSKVAYTGLNSALAHGGMSDASRFVSSLTRSLQGLASSMDMTLVSTPIHAGIAKKVNRQQQELAFEKEKNKRSMEALKQLMEQVESKNGSKGNQVEVEANGNSNLPIQVG